MTHHRAALPGESIGRPPGGTARRSAVPGWLQRLPGALELAAMLAAGTALSWFFTGHVFGHSNNVFHLPIVAGLATQPGFDDDAFVQSLAGFASGLWMLLEGRDTPWPAPQLFAAGLAASKALSLLGAVLVARALGLMGRRRTLAFVAVVAATPLLQGTSYAGHGGLFVDFFSHSELASGLALVMWWALLTRRPGLALALNGGVAFLNAFMAAWNLVPLGLCLWRQRPVRLRSLWPGAGVALGLLAPVAWRIAASWPAPGAELVDLREFVRTYYPYHFLADEMPLAQWLGLATVLGAAFVGLRWLRESPAANEGVPLLRVLLHGYLVVYAAGIVAPLASGAPWVIQLHLLRSSAFFHWLAAIVLALVLVQPGPVWRRVLLLPALLTARPALVLALPMLLVRGRPRRGLDVAARVQWLAAGHRLGEAVPRAAVLLGVTVVLAWHAATLPARQQHVHALGESAAQWAALAQRIGERTPPGATVLLPLRPHDGPGPDAGSGVFEYASRRSVWVDHKRGAAVLWQPAYHASWRTRMDEVAALAGWRERLDYGARRGLAMVVGRCDELPAGMAPDVRAGPLCAVRPGVATGPAVPAAQG
ncbi:MAG: hypothetical protein KIT17_06065 [Rubrivivax sp.]|nr:hypothetical protein [Rubrivivax sp.]